MPTPTIPAGNLFMNATLYTGTGVAQTITNGAAGQSFQPDFVWLKCRSNATNHYLVDSVRGSSADLYSNSTAAEASSANIVSAFTSNGFSIGTDAEINGSGRTNVGWQWKAGGTATTNNSGSISSQVSANTTSGFSVVTYTGTLTAAGTATVGHGLGVAPAMIIFKGRNAVTSWPVFHTSLTSWNYCCILDGTNAQINQTSNGSMSAPTSTVFSTNWTTGMNINGTTEVAYCFAPIAGYSAFGSYTGNGSTDGPFIYTGFRPRWIMIKNSSAAGNGWIMMDSSRNTYNQTTYTLYPNSSGAETNNTTYSIDILSNGFKVRASDPAINGSTNTLIYACFAENPFKYSNAR
jgi:hypothetical protein